jgi:hypothetical protein
LGFQGLDDFSHIGFPHSHNRKNNDRLEEISHRSTFVLYPKMPRANAPVNINAGSAQNVTGPEREHRIRHHAGLHAGSRRQYDQAGRELLLRCGTGSSGTRVSGKAPMLK